MNMSSRKGLTPIKICETAPPEERNLTLQTGPGGEACKNCIAILGQNLREKACGGCGANKLNTDMIDRINRFISDPTVTASVIEELGQEEFDKLVGMFNSPLEALRQEGTKLIVEVLDKLEI